MRTAALLCAALASAGCFVVLDHEGVELQERDTFIALQADFAGFDQWPSVEVADDVDAVHIGARRRVYINQLPGEGDELAFPVGTIIVKTGAGGELTGTMGDDVHAMVKRGAPFNPDGAAGWEWFELSKDDAPAIVWRGFEPPSGESYGCSPGVDCDENIVDCNGCHLDSSGSDYVHSFALP